MYASKQMLHCRSLGVVKRAPSMNQGPASGRFELGLPWQTLQTRYAARLDIQETFTPAWVSLPLDRHSLIRHDLTLSDVLVTNILVVLKTTAVVTKR